MKKLRNIIFALVAFSIPIGIMYLIFLNVVLVEYERSSGTELVILSGGDQLLNEGSQFGVNYSEGAYTTYKFDSDYGFTSIGTSLAFYKLIGSKNVEDSPNKKAAILRITKFYSIVWVILIFIAGVLVYLFLLSKVKKNLFQHS